MRRYNYPNIIHTIYCLSIFSLPPSHYLHSLLHSSNSVLIPPCVITETVGAQTTIDATTTDTTVVRGEDAQSSAFCRLTIISIT